MRDKKMMGCSKENEEKEVSYHTGTVSGKSVLSVRVLFLAEQFAPMNATVLSILRRG
jgi:hypothetical protein